MNEPAFGEESGSILTEYARVPTAFGVAGVTAF